MHVVNYFYNCAIIIMHVYVCTDVCMYSMSAYYVISHYIDYKFIVQS